MATAEKIQAPEAVVRAGFEALDAHDLDRMESLWHEDIVEEFIPVGTYRGKAAVRGYFAEVIAAFPDFRIRIEHLVAQEGHVFVEWQATGTHTGAAFMGIDPTGRSLTQGGIDHFVVEDGLVRRNTVYYDGMAFARQAGLLPERESTLERAMFTAFNAVTRARGALAERTGG
jgi:steroid delta-isomerase-like uncharacterized protein